LIKPRERGEGNENRGTVRGSGVSGGLLHTERIRNYHVNGQAERAPSGNRKRGKRGNMLIYLWESSRGGLIMQERRKGWAEDKGDSPGGTGGAKKTNYDSL